MIMSPLRRPGHVSMEAGDFPEHTADAQRLPLDPGAVTSPPVLTPKAGYLLYPDSLLSPAYLSISDGYLCPAILDHPSLLVSAFLLPSNLFPPTCPPTGSPMAGRMVADLRTDHVTALLLEAWHSRLSDNKASFHPYSGLYSLSPRHSPHWALCPSCMQLPQPGDSNWFLGALLREAS